MTDYFHPQPWRTFTTPLTIPHPRSHDAHKQYQYHPYRSPYSAWRSATPPSLSPSPSPSTTSTTSSTHSTHSNLEIEELETEDDIDSGIELLVGEYEEAPENYGRLVYDSDVDTDSEDDVDIAASHNRILYGFERLNARTSPVMGMKGAKGEKTVVCGFPIPRRAKRSYAESEGSSAVSSVVEEKSWWGDSGLESEEEGRRVRRRIVRRVKMEEEDCVSVKSWGEGAGSDNEIDMEL